MSAQFDRDLFEQAFSADAASCRVDCPCGRIFWDSSSQSCFGVGEFEMLMSHPNAVEVDYSIPYVEFGGKMYSAACDCWVPTAKIIATFLNGHGHKIARFLNARKEKAIKAATNLPEVNP